MPFAFSPTKTRAATHELQLTPLAETWVPKLDSRSQGRCDDPEERRVAAQAVASQWQLGREYGASMEPRRVQPVVGVADCSVVPHLSGTVTPSRRGAHADPLSTGKGVKISPTGQQKLPLSGGFPGQLVDQPFHRRVGRRRETSQCVARPGRCVRFVSSCLSDWQHKSAHLQGTLCKPSDGLEPSTPSLPWRCSTD